MRSQDVVRIARQRAGLTQQQLAARSGHPRETIARWESGAREPSLASLRAVVAACGLELVVRIAEGDESLDTLVDDQLALGPRERLVALLPQAEAEDALCALRLLATARGSTIVIGGIAAALRGAPQRPAGPEVEVVADDPEAFAGELRRLGLSPVDDEQRWAERDRRWSWELPHGGSIVLATLVPGSNDHADLRRGATPIEVDGATTVTVAHPRDLLRIADASPRESERARVPGLRALLDRLTDDTPGT